MYSKPDSGIHVIAGRKCHDSLQESQFIFASRFCDIKVNQHVICCKCSFGQNRLPRDVYYSFTLPLIK